MQVQKYLIAGFKVWKFSRFAFPAQPLRRHAQIAGGKAQWKQSVMQWLRAHANILAYRHRNVCSAVAYLLRNLILGQLCG